jgi:hypothetical protein
MAFIVQTYAMDTGGGASMTIERREDALETALCLIERGGVGVKIIGDGRIYNAAEFSLTVPKTRPDQFFDGRSSRRNATR